MVDIFKVRYIIPADRFIQTRKSLNGPFAGYWGVRKMLRTVLTLLILFAAISAAGAQPVEEWNKTFDWNESDRANSVQQTGDGGYIIAGWTGVTEFLSGNRDV